MMHFSLDTINALLHIHDIGPRRMHIMERLTLGDKVRVKREESHLTQAELAKRAGLTQATISRIERKEVKQLKSDAIRKLAQALGVTTDFLVSDMQRMEFEETLLVDETAKVIFRGYENLSHDRRRQLKEYVDHLIQMQKREKKSE
jgi:transcriptional regulator with XRE-family HTH domain